MLDGTAFAEHRRLSSGKQSRVLLCKWSLCTGGRLPQAIFLNNGNRCNFVRSKGVEQATADSRHNWGVRAAYDSEGNADRH